MDHRRTLVKAVVDTNVVADFLLGTEQYAEEARSFLAVVSEPQAPALWGVELANVIWMATRQQGLDNSGCSQPADSGRQPGNSYRSEPNSLARRANESPRIGYCRL